MNSRAILLAELEEKSQKNKDLSISAGELQVSEPALGGGYNPYDNPGTHKTTLRDGKAQRPVSRRS